MAPLRLRADRLITRPGTRRTTRWLLWGAAMSLCPAAETTLEQLRHPIQKVTVSGSGMFIGGLIGSTLTRSGGASLYVDDALASYTGDGGSQLLSQLRILQLVRRQFRSAAQCARYGLPSPSHHLLSLGPDYARPAGASSRRLNIPPFRKPLPDTRLIRPIWPERVAWGERLGRLLARRRLLLV